MDPITPTPQTQPTSPGNSALDAPGASTPYGPPPVPGPAGFDQASPASPSTMPPVNSREQALERIRSATNVLITVSTDPSVDALSSALALTLQLDKMGKHATTVFSGKIPRAIEFLDPAATFEENVDSLRDFIIALDKEKADKLRYKVEDDMVRIFITPYKTTITKDDLQFSQGDFNVEVVVALGVVERDDLDKAITAHGRILHDATVITVNVGDEKSSLGAIDWHEPTAGSIAETLADATESLGSELVDSQVATAYLTGIVAATNRFSNEKTTPKVMTLSARLMAAGANQQLIASNLRQDGMLSDSVREAPGHHPEQSIVVAHDSSKKSTKKKAEKPESETDDDDKAREKTEDDVSLAPVDFPPKEEAADQPDQAEASLDLPEDLKAQLEGEGGSGVTAEVIEQKDDSVAKDVEITDVKTGESSEVDQTTPDDSSAEPTNDVPAFNATMAATEAADTSAHQPSAAVSPAAAQEDALEEARRAVETAAESAPFNPANQPLQSLNAQPLDQTPTGEVATNEVTPVASTDQATEPASAPQAHLTAQSSFMSGELDKPEPTPMDSFMSAHEKPVIQPEMSSPVTDTAFPPNGLAPSASSFDQPGASNDSGAMPPLPPTPPAIPNDASLPPLPPLPGADVAQAPMQPTVSPNFTPGFAEGMNASQNQWTQAGDDLAAKQAQEQADRQAKMDSMTADYDRAVDRNQELQGKPPVNDPNGSGLPPLPPAPTL